MLCGVDIYDASIKRLQADSRTPRELSDYLRIPAGTLRDIKKGICKDPSFSTVKKIALGYFPSERGRRIAA
jgi:hypothetical protein